MHLNRTGKSFAHLKLLHFPSLHLSQSLMIKSRFFGNVTEELQRQLSCFFASFRNSAQAKVDDKW